MVVTKKRMLKPLRELPEHRFGVAVVYRVE
jgi:hypothetical protein